MTIKKIPPSRREIRKFPYPESRPRENQLGQLMRWLLAAVGTTIKDWCAAQEGLHQNSYYNATSLDYSVTAKMILTFKELISKTVGVEDIISFEEIQNLVKRPYNQPPLAWRGVAMVINSKFEGVWQKGQRKKVKR